MSSIIKQLVFICSCHICLELNNKNSCHFCCGNYHNNCIIKALKTVGKCPLCRYEYRQYKDALKYDTFTKNIDQLVHNILQSLMYDQMNYNQMNYIDLSQTD